MERDGANPAQRFMVDGHGLTLLVEGEERLAALLGLIEGAAAEVRLLYYLFLDDPVGRRVRAALVEARRRGVRVRVLVDGFGSDPGGDAFFRPLREAGAEVCRFHPRFGCRYLLRNHQKMALADGVVALIGGFNVAESYFASGADAWRDLGLLVEGPAAAHLRGYFDALFGWTADPRARMRTLTRLLRRWSQRQGRLRWLFGGPTQRASPWLRALRSDIGRSRRLDVIAAYFAPNPGMLRRLGRLARRGALRILTASRSDNVMTVAAARACYPRLLRRGARIWEYRPMKLHGKLFVADDAVYLGSANFDIRSLYLNCEVMLRIEDAAFAAHLRALFEREAGDAREADAEQIRRAAGLWTRLRWRIAYFLVTIVDYGVTRRLNFRNPGPEIG